jgi:hypothetical protein
MPDTGRKKGSWCCCAFAGTKEELAGELLCSDNLGGTSQPLPYHESAEWGQTVSSMLQWWLFTFLPPCHISESNRWRLWDRSVFSVPRGYLRRRESLRIIFQLLIFKKETFPFFKVLFSLLQEVYVFLRKSLEKSSVRCRITQQHPETTLYHCRGWKIWGEMTF